MSGPPTNNGAGSSQLTDPLSFASKLFQQIGNADFSLDEDSRSESDDADESQSEDDTLTPAKTTRPLETHTDQGQNEGRLSKKAKLEAMTNLINAGMPGAATKSQAQTQAQTHYVTPMTVDTPSQIQFSQFNLQSVAGTPAPGTPTPISIPQEFNLTMPQLKKKPKEAPIATPTPQPTPQNPLPRQPSAQSVSSSPSSTASASASTLPSIPTVSTKPAKVIDLTMTEETTEISDDEVVIDESRTTTIANRNMCFGMIQSLVVTLYPRHLEYEEGKADKVIIKRATTAGKASLAVEHENGLVCCF